MIARIIFWHHTFFSLLLFTFPQSLYAHTRWFADEALPQLTTSEPISLYITVWSVLVLLFFSIAIYLQRFALLELPQFTPSQAHDFSKAATAFIMLVGAYFIIAGSHEYFLTPNITASERLPFIFVALQIIIGICILTGIASRIAALSLIPLWLVSFFYTGFIEGIENIWLPAVAFFIAIYGNEYQKIYSNSYVEAIFSRYKKYGLSLLRIGSGLSLIILGLTEKITAPEYGVNFLLQYNWNFMAYLGLEYSDILFTISAGAVEVLLGLLIAFGILTRLTVAVVVVIFAIPMFILGPIELTGHLPNFAALALLFFYGAGTYFRPFTYHSASGSS
jgi:uncharacterized membrane protein YphA (DoxX/SURF4 family)